MKFGEKIEKNEIVRVVIILSIIASLVISISIIVGNRKLYDNDQVYGDFAGEIRIAEHDGLKFNFNMTFDGKRECIGIIEIENQNYELSSTYACMSLALEFSFHISDLGYYFSFDGSITDSGTIMSGNVRYYETSSQTYNGTFYLSKYF